MRAMTTEKQRRSAAYERLLARYENTASGEERWNLLMAAHVVGQREFGLHWDSHARMLRLAWQAGDLPEIAGQVFRLALTPVGHLAGRLPAGNVGRSTVSAFRPMQPPPPVQQLVAWAVEASD